MLELNLKHDGFNDAFKAFTYPLHFVRPRLHVTSLAMGYTSVFSVRPWLKGGRA